MEAAMVVKVTAALVSTLTKFASEKLFTSIQKRYEKWKSVDGDIHFIKTELGMIVATLESQFLQGVHPNGVHAVAMNTLRDLAYDIEDCFDRFLLCTSCEGQDVPFLSDFPTKIQDLKTRLMDARKQILDYASINNGQPTAAVSASTRAPLPKVKQPLGIDKPKKELIDLLLAKDVKGQQEQPRVISIVGFGGSGKTRLARELYGCRDVVREFPTRAWVDASKYKNDYKGLLLALLKKLRRLQGEDTVDSEVEELQDEIFQYLNDERSLIVLDDIEEQQWDPSMLPENTGSRIIVTTTSQLAANYCSYGGGYIHNTSTLDKKYSDDLLKALLTGHSRDLEQVSASIVNTCDGHPLSLVSVANFLKRVNSLTESSEDICHRLGSQVEKAPAFQELREVLMSNYGNLSDHLVKTCLLYMSVFPKGFEIRRNSLARRWVAEGFAQSVGKVTDETVAHENFKKLLDQNIIEPMGACDNARVKTCRTHAVMREFMLHRSLCDHFIGSLDTMSESDDPSTFRHLFIQNCTNNNILRSAKKELRARSLTIFGSGGGAISCIAECELLQALDLKECNDFGDNLVKAIMRDNLRRLKYLSLGSATTKLPKAIEKLHCLHTLELSKTKVVALPIEVIKLAHLVHLFGKVKLRQKRKFHALQVTYDIISKKKSIGEKSKLQTLSGFIIDKDYIIPQLMVHMRGLRKVKIWYDSTGGGNTNWIIHLKEAIENMVMYEMDTGVGVRSLSLYLGNALENLLGRLRETIGFLTTLKLHGRLSQFPMFVTSLTGIKELCLSSTNLTGSDLSESGLGELPCLLYLKLIERHLMGFVIKKGDFPVLKRLCLVVESPILPKIEEEALPELVSLHLLCVHLGYLAGINITNHTNLQEVALDSAVSRGTINTWENEAQKHPKRPKVLFFKKVGTANTECKVKYTATERPKTPESTGPGDLMEIDNSGPLPP